MLKLHPCMLSQELTFPLIPLMMLAVGGEANIAGGLQGAALDRHSACCTSGKVDACGVCDGPAKAVDVQGACCSSGVLDGDGYCCASGLLDECGVCDGQSTACALRAVFDVQVSTRTSFGHV